MNRAPGPEASFDVVVVGGGVNGTGIARDFALRGLKVALVEKQDLAVGASGNSSGMIHGGPRYLLKTPEVTISSCLDSGYIQKIAPHMLFRVPFLMPVLPEERGAELKLLTYDGFFRAYDRYQDLKRSHPHLCFGKDEVRALEPGLVPAVGAITFDEWGLDGVRLCVANALHAEQLGAAIFVGYRAVGLVADSGGKARGLELEGPDGQLRTLSARAIVNATGAWTGKTAELFGIPDEGIRVRPGKGIHVYLDRRLSNFAIVTNAIDGRQVFLLPWQNMSVLGTTDDDYYGDLDDVVATVDEVRYLYQAIERVFPLVRAARPIGTWAGLRPTLYAWGVPEDALSRDHRTVDHERYGRAGLFSMVGGKLASYRLFAEETADIVCRWLGTKAPCRTHLVPLPGGEETVPPGKLQELSGIDALTERRLIARHGSRALPLAEDMKRGALSSEVVCPCEPVTEAEIRATVRHEWARSVDDVARRTRLGLGPCGGKLCARRAGEIVAEELGLTPEAGEESAALFLRGNERRTACLKG